MVNKAAAHIAVAVLAAVAQAGPTSQPGSRRDLALVDEAALIESVTREALMQCAQDLEDIAYATPGRTRVIGSEGHDKTVEYVVRELESVGDYWSIEKQPFTTQVTLDSSSSVTVDGEALEAEVMDFSANGTWTDTAVVPVANLGCDAADYPDAVEGSVALIARGDCTFALKAQLAQEQGAVAALVYNSLDTGIAAGTLGGENDFVPVAGISRADGLRLAEQYAGGGEQAAPVSTGDLWTYIVDATSFNVVASSKTGDPDNVLMLGAHSDSVAAGPGINDNGSGSCGLLTIAKALSRWDTRNQVRFAWWTAEEEGLLGAEHYTNVTPAADLARIRLYLNFDMIASPNYVFGVYDGDGSAFNLSGPAGSAEAEALFESYYAAAGVPFVPSEFDGRSDYGPFLDKGVPSGGLDTGADGVKTEEEAERFGGTPGVIYDPNYHSAADNVTNLAPEAFETCGKAIAHAVATYATSWDGFPAREAPAPAVGRRADGPAATPKQKRARKAQGAAHDWASPHRALAM